MTWSAEPAAPHRRGRGERPPVVPTPLASGFGAEALQQGGEALPRDLTRPQGDQVIGDDLAVDGHEAPGSQTLAQVHQGHLGGVVGVGEHGFPEKMRQTARQAPPGHLPAH
jgi:hypothetical protein